MLHRSLACVLVVLTLTAAAPAPAPPSAASARDHVYALAGTWSCRSAEGVLTRSTGVREGDVVKVHHEVDRDGRHSSFDDRYTFDPAQQRWHVVSGLSGFTTDSAPWVAGTWTIQGTDVNTVGRRMTVELVPNGDYRRTMWYENGASVFVLESAELCTPGATPPPAGACIAANYPAATLEAPPVNARFLPRNGPFGVVQVIVSLNERSEVVSARVQSSPDAAFNGPALATVRASKFRTEVRNCKPIAADYVFSVSFEP